MRRFDDLPLRLKLTLGMTLIACAALFLSALATFGYGAYAIREAKARQLGTLADMVGRNSQAALAFNDPAGAAQLLEALKAIPGLDQACVFDASGRPFADFPVGTIFPAPTGVDGTSFSGGHLLVFRQIRKGDDLLGTVYLREDLGDLRQALRWNLLFNLALLMALGLLVLWISARVQRFVTAPLVDLGLLTRKVSEEKDYGVRAKAQGGDEIGALVSSFNGMLSEIQKRDQELAGYREHLEEQVAARTEDLLRSNQQLLVAKQRAEEVSRAKSAFLANMSHELRTPLNAILLYSQLLQEDAKEQARDSDLADLGRIQGSASHLLTLINDILDLSKIEAGRMSLSPEPVDLRVLVEESLDTIRPLALKNGNGLEAPRLPALKPFMADPTKLRQALFNLLSNACKFTEKGKVELRVEPFDMDGAPWIRLAVSDTGIGMTEEQMGRIFQEFTQAEEGTARRYGGTGLGLALSRRLCELMGGRIAARSVQGQGSTFTIEIPAPPVPPKGEPHA